MLLPIFLSAKQDLDFSHFLRAPRHPMEHGKPRFS